MKHARKDYDRIQDPAGLIPQDEPVFLIRGQDEVGPEVLRCWATLAELAGADREIISKVMDHAEAMERWQIQHRRKIPDLPEGA